MSNQQVGVVFESVIQEVCNSSRIDFEESGVDQQTLEELRKGWQKKLSSVGIAHFPWDPAPQPAPAPSQDSPIPPPAVTVPSNAPQTSPPPPPPDHGQVPSSNELSSQAYTAPEQNAEIPAEPAPRDVQVKSEAPVVSPPVSSSNARQRAADMLQQRYGAAAAQQVQQLQSQSPGALALPGQQRDAVSQNQDQQSSPPPQPLPQGQSQTQPQDHSQDQKPSVGNAQTDGASDSLADWKAEVARRREAAEKDAGEGDHFLREYVASRGLLMEGGGVLAPFQERYSGARSTKRQGPGEAKQVRFVEPNLQAPSSMPAPARYDGVDDDVAPKDEDEDAINSDLDDPEDDLLDGDPENEESGAQVMLCTYDKVQRVKSKWKCTLKDGILTSGGKDYVFQKATGEFEW